MSEGDTVITTLTGLGGVLRVCSAVDSSLFQQHLAHGLAGVGAFGYEGPDN